MQLISVAEGKARLEYDSFMTHHIHLENNLENQHLDIDIFDLNLETDNVDHIIIINNKYYRTDLDFEKLLNAQIFELLGALG